MARKRQYSTNADRQREYRKRRKTAADQPIPVPLPLRSSRTLSRPARLARLGTDLQTLLLEYEQWLGAIPEALHDTDQATRLSETIEQLTAASDLLADVIPPRGFGRD
jgi:hypothetical protein